MGRNADAPAAGGDSAGRMTPTTSSLYPADTRSFYEQFQALKGSKDLSIIHSAYPKPSLAAQRAAPTAHGVPVSDVVTCDVDRPLLAAQPKTLTPEETEAVQQYSFFWRRVGFVVVHAVVLSSVWFTFSWRNLAMGLAVWAATICWGINMCYHRLLAHRSFKTVLPIEYLTSFLAVHAMQGPPIEWVSNHRYHHLHTDTPLDPHSPYEGFYHAHMGWLFDKADVERYMLDRSNVTDISAHAFYRLMEATWVQQMLIRMFATWYFFGYGALVWSMGFPIFVGWHETFLVNSAAHLWGRQPYDTGDLSRNNWWVAAISFGEGWHNSHHAFPFSARHGLEWYEIDLVYASICTLRALGLAWDVKLPSQRDKDRRRQPDQKQKIW